MSNRSSAIFRGLNSMRSVFRSESDDQVFEQMLDQIAMDRTVLVLDMIAEKTVFEFTKNWILLNSPATAYARGNAVLSFVVRYRTRFMLLDFHPDNLARLWSEIRSPENPSVLQFVAELATDFRMRVVARDEELDEMTNHLAQGLTWIHRSDRRLIDSVLPEDVFVTDEQFHDELPSVESVEEQLRANTWLLPLLYCHRFTQEQIDELGLCVYAQTVAAAKQPAAPNGSGEVVPRSDDKA